MSTFLTDTPSPMPRNEWFQRYSTNGAAPIAGLGNYFYLFVILLAFLSMLVKSNFEITAVLIHASDEITKYTCCLFPIELSQASQSQPKDLMWSAYHRIPRSGLFLTFYFINFVYFRRVTLLQC